MSTFRVVTDAVVLSGHARQRHAERIGGDADSFAAELARSLGDGRYRPAWRSVGVYVDAGTGSALVDVSRVPPLAVTVYAESATPRYPREGTVNDYLDGLL